MTFISRCWSGIVSDCFLTANKPEPIMLLVLPIIPSSISHNFYPLFLFYFHAITYYSCYIPINFYFVSDNEVHSLFSS